MRTIVAIAFALTLTCAFGAFSASNWVKAPVSALNDGDTNFTNMTSGPFLASVQQYEVDLITTNMTPQTNLSANNWGFWLKKITVKDLSSTSNMSLAFTFPLAITSYSNNYAISILPDNETNTPQLRVYQQPLAGGAAIPRITLTANTNQTHMPMPVGTVFIKKTGYIFYVAADKKVNCTSFTVGGTAQGTGEFTLTSAYEKESFGVIWGEALSTSQVFAIWKEGDVLKDAVVDVSKGTFTANTVGGYTTSHSCFPYSTDKKWYGEFCITFDFQTTQTNAFWVRTNTSNIVSFFNATMNTTAFGGIFPYGPYLVVVTTDSVTSKPSKVHSYTIWNLDTLTVQKEKTTFLTIDVNSSFAPLQVQGGGLYGLLYNNRQALNATFTGVVIGLILGSSYLISALGFLLTIIAGLFLF